MGRRVPKEFYFTGLNTKSQTTGLPVADSVVLQDLRVVGTDLVERLGISRVAQFTGNMSAMDFDAATSQLAVAAVIDTRVWALGLYWTVELAIELDVTTGTQTILWAGHTTAAMVVDITGGNIRLRVWDSAATLTTVTIGAATTSVQTIQITRSAATLSTRLNNGTAVTGSMSATLSVRTPVGALRVGADDSLANFLDGTICYLNVLSTVKADHNDRLLRIVYPRAKNVLACYDFKRSGVASSIMVYDRSRYANHMELGNVPTEVAALCHNPAPIRALSMFVDPVTNRKQLLVAVGGNYFLCDID